MGNVRRHWGKIRSSIRKLMGIWRETCREFPLRGFLRRFSIRFIYNWNCPRMSMKSYDYGEIYLISKSVHSSHFSMMPRPPSPHKCHLTQKHLSQWFVVANAHLLFSPNHFIDQPPTLR